MKVCLKKRYNHLGGIGKVLSAFRSGQVTLTEISEQVGVSKTTVSNDLKTAFGSTAFKSARNERRYNLEENRIIARLNKGKNIELLYDDVLTHLNAGKIGCKYEIKRFKKIIILSTPYTGKPSRVCFYERRVTSVCGINGIVKIRYAEPTDTRAEYKINRYRFKITPARGKGAKATIFCLNANNILSYYVIPSENLANIKSLNLKFDEHGKSKYAKFLDKVESTK